MPLVSPLLKRIGMVVDLSLNFCGKKACMDSVDATDNSRECDWLFLFKLEGVVHEEAPQLSSGYKVKSTTAAVLHTK